MIIQDRQYQNDTEAALREGYRTHLRQVMCMPTGSGKTVVFSKIIAKTIARGKRVLCLSDRTEIFKQTLKAISRHDIAVCKIDRDNRYISSDAMVYLAMCETFKRRIEKLKHLKFDLIIVDESHRKAYDPIIEAFPDVHVLGCSATPGPTKLYSNLVQLIQVQELIDKGFLMPCRAYQMVDDLSDIEIKKSGGFEETSHFAHYNKRKLYEGCVTSYLEKCKGRQTIVYNVSIEHSNLMTQAFNAAGIKSYSITSETSDKEREWILQEFSMLRFPVLNNCGCLTTGTDIPTCSAIIINRAISILSLFIQIVGRGGRPCPEIGKTDFVCVDHGLNHDRFGLWQEDRIWSLDPPKKNKKGLGAMPIKSCPKCACMVSAQARQCEHCGFVFQPSEAELAQGRLVEVTNKIREAIPGKYVSQLTIPELIELEKTKQMKPAYVWRAVRAKGSAAIYQYAEIKGHRPEWTVRQLEVLEAEGKVEFFDKKINEIEML